MSQLISGKKTPSLDTLQRIADVLDVDLSSLYDSARPVPVAGRVGAGASVELVDAFEKGDGLYKVASPEDIPAASVVAVEVQGDSMAPLIMPGDVLFFSRHFMGVDESAINRVSICETDDGRALVKQIRIGRETGLFDLYSANNNQPPEYGVKLIWAAPLRRHLAKSDVERLGA